MPHFVENISLRNTFVNLIMQTVTILRLAPLYLEAVQEFTVFASCRIYPRFDNC